MAFSDVGMDNCQADNTYCKLPNNSWGVYLFQSLNRAGVYLRSGGNFGQAFNSIVVHLLQVKLLRRRKWFSQPALTANSSSLLSLTEAYICFANTLIILWLRARLLITQSHMFISGSSLAFFLPPPGSLALFAVLLGQTLKLSFIFSPISHSLGFDREMSSGWFSWVFLCIFYDRKFEFQVVLFI